MPRTNGRRFDQMRPVKIVRDFVRTADGSCLIEVGETRVICTASVAQGVPPFLAGRGRGWVTAEYGMLPASTGQRKERRSDGRAIEIQRLIGRSLRAVTDLSRLDGLTVTIDCDVLQADGGTRTAAITGAWVALAEALHRQRQKLPGRGWPLTSAAVATSAGLLDGRPLLDLEYREDSRAEVDINVVMTAGGRFIEIQATGEEHTFAGPDLARLLDLARKGCKALAAVQKKTLSSSALWPGK